MSDKPVLRLSFSVKGTPVPQGSKRVWVNSKTGKAQMTEDAGVRHSTWRNEVTGQARQAMADAGRFGEDRVFYGPISCLVTFRVHRPKHHYRTGKNAKLHSGSASPYPASAPDLDKLVRAIWDSLTSVVWMDDGQVVAATIRKQWVERWEEDGVDIKVGTFMEQDDGIE